jgi:hypothetical protein
MSALAIPFHPLAGIFPLLEGEAFAALVADIRAKGLHEPIVLHEGKILDGRNRYRACIEAGIAPRFESYSGSDPLGYVVSLNLERRHLDESQRAMVAARIATLQHGTNQHTRGSANLPVQSQAAELLNVSERSVRSARTVQTTGARELVHAVEAGKVKVSVAANIATLSKAPKRSSGHSSQISIGASSYKPPKRSAPRRQKSAGLNVLSALSPSAKAMRRSALSKPIQSFSQIRRGNMSTRRWVRPIARSKITTRQ